MDELYEFEMDEPTEREMEVWSKLPQGKTNKQIAAELYISPKTVENYVTSLLKKLGAANRTEAAVMKVHHDNEETGGFPHAV